MIKVIEVSSDTNIGGAGKCLITLAKNYDRAKLDMSVVVPVGSLLKAELEAAGVRVIEANAIAERSLSVQGISELLKIFRRERPDIVHAHASMSARIAARRCGAKVVYTRHSVFEPSARTSSGVGKLICGAVNNHYADAIIAVAEAAKENIVKIGVNPNKITVILNGVDALCMPGDVSDIKARFGVSDEKVVSIVARLEDIKGHLYFIDAARAVLEQGINVKFFIAGTGSFESVLKARVEEIGLSDKIIFTGFINDVDRLMAITDVQVNASYGTEATSLALLEGMSIGVPAVVSDFGGNPGVIKNGENGFVVEKKNSAALADAIMKLLSDDELYTRMSNTSREIFNREFTSLAMTKKTEDLYINTLRKD